MNRSVALALILIGGRAFAGAPDIAPNPSPASDDLTLGNFFSEGWNQPWKLRESAPGGSPDLPLFHSPTNFLFRGSRTDYSFQNSLNKTGADNIQYLDEYFDYAFNQRFMISLFGNYTWVNRETNRDVDGGGGGMIGRFQLVDTPASSLSLNLRLDLPDKDIGVHTTKLSEALAGWQDLTPLGAKRMALYYNIQNNAYAGMQNPGQARDDFSYDVGLARTWTKSSAPVADLTSFVEFSGATNTDGNRESLTELTVTPGLQFILGKRNVIMMGVDFPLTHPADYREIYRITYIYAF